MLRWFRGGRWSQAGLRPRTKRAAFAELYAIAEIRLLGQLAGHGQECRARVEADRPAARTDASGDFPSDDTAAAANVKDALPGGDAEQVEIGLARVDFVLRFGAELEPTCELARLRGVRAGSVAPEALSSVLAHVPIPQLRILKNLPWSLLQIAIQAAIGQRSVQIEEQRKRLQLLVPPRLSNLVLDGLLRWAAPGCT